jgi:mannose-1-phosphate guanylyltransferase
MITVGINPTRPDTGFGYIQMGDEKATLNNQKVFSIANFKEKPDALTAEHYLRDWAYLWNGGYFIFSAPHFLTWCQEYAPALFENISKLVNSNSEEQLEIYQGLAAEPVEPLIIEKLPAEKRLVIPSALEWSDVGNWATLLEELQKITGESVIRGENHVDVKSKNLLVKRSGKDKRFIGTIGLNDIVIVETEDALLVANKNTVATEIKDLLEEIKKERQDLL